MNEDPAAVLVEFPLRCICTFTRTRSVYRKKQPLLCNLPVSHPTYLVFHSIGTSAFKAPGVAFPSLILHFTATFLLVVNCLY